MDDEVLDEQRVLIDRIAAEGWTVTDAELSVYESPWEGEDAPEATVTITARKAFPDAETAGKNIPEGEREQPDDDDDNPFRVN